MLFYLDVLSALEDFKTRTSKSIEFRMIKRRTTIGKTWVFNWVILNQWFQIG